MDVSQVIVRNATLPDLVQCCEIYNYYILNTTKALFEHPFSVVDIINSIFRKSLELGYPFLVIALKSAPHIVLGFTFAAENIRLIKLAKLTTTGTFLREDMVNKGFYEVNISQIFKQITETVFSGFTGNLVFANYTNRPSVHKLDGDFSGLGFASSLVFKNSGYKNGKYQDIALYFYSPKHVQAMRSLRARL
jgi:L-amino acid N-acyltransferase YncA